MANLNDEKLKMMEDEMNRFEAEIALPVLPPPPPPPNVSATTPPPPRPVIGSNTYNQVQRRLEEQQTVLVPDFAGGAGGGPPPMGFQPSVMPPVAFTGIPPPPPPPPPLLIPHQVQRVPPARHPPPPPPAFLRGPPPPLRAVAPTAPPAGTFVGATPLTTSLESPTGPPQPSAPAQNVPTVLSATPKIYVSKPSGKTPTDINSLSRTDDDSSERKKKLKKLGDKPDPSESLGVWGAREMAERVRASTVVTTIGPDPATSSAPAGRKKDKKPKKHVRTAGGQTWEDSSLAEWDEDDFRIFCGDLGNDVTDEILTRAFSKYSSFQRAKVVRDKRTNKTKGFGFVSFKDPQDFIKAMKEMNGRYVGSRPIKLRKSTWKARNLDTVRRKEKEKAALVGLLLASVNENLLEENKSMMSTEEMQIHG